MEVYMSLVDHDYTVIIPNKSTDKDPDGEIGIAYIQNFQIRFYIDENRDLIAAYTDERAKMLTMYINTVGELIVCIPDDQDWLINSLPYFHIDENKDLIMES
jgi:hypothetical protein